MHKIIKKYRINKVYGFSKGSDICEYIIKCYNKNKVEIDYIYIMIKNSIDKLGVNQLYKLFLQIPFDDELTHILNKKMANNYDRKISVEYLISDNYKASDEEEIDILTKIFNEKNDYELSHYCEIVLNFKKINNNESEDHILPIIKAACNSKKGYVIYNITKKLKLSKKSTLLIIDTLKEIDNIKYAYLFLKDTINLMDDEVYEIIDIICKSKNYEYIYKTSLIFPEYKILYRNALLSSKNIYYLTLYSLYVDDILINKIFNSRVRMLEYMKLYNFDLKDIEYAAAKFNYNINNLQTINDKVENNVIKLSYELSVNNK